MQHTHSRIMLAGIQALLLGLLHSPRFAVCADLLTCTTIHPSAHSRWLCCVNGPGVLLYRQTHCSNLTTQRCLVKRGDLVAHFLFGADL